MPEVFVPPDREEGERLAALPPGVFKVSVDAVEAAWGNKGPYIKWTLVVEEPEQFKGSKLFHNTSMAEQARSFPGDGFYAVLNRFALDTALEGRAMEFEELVAELNDIAPGCLARVAVSQHMYNDKPQNDCDEFYYEDEKAPPVKVFESSGNPAAAGGGAGSGSTPTGPTGATGRSRGPTRRGSSGPAAEPPY